MIDTNSESMMPLAAAAREVPNRSGKLGIDVSTIWRWTNRGIRGVKLETILVGGVRYTSREALQRFFERTTAVADGTTAATRTHTQRQHDIWSAERELEEEGI